ncbi:MAG: hypothetical protein ABSF25_26865, partial [Bryobacteraceae bacterium]
MVRHRLIRAVALAGLSALCAAAASDNASGEPAGSGGLDARAGAPPVLRNTDPTDTRIVRLPGPPRVEAPIAPPAPAPAPAPVAIAAPAPPPVREAAPAPAPRLPKPSLSATMTASAPRTPSATPKPPPATPRPRRPLPPDFQRDSAEFCRQRIGAWTEADARALLGEPKRSRPSFGPDNTENGQILAFADPSGRHHQLELDFDRVSGRLRTVFVYPWDMTWEDCQRLWGTAVLPANSNKGRTFYSYTDRRLDVLVDADEQ